MEDIQKIRELIESKIDCFNDSEYLQMMNLLKSVYDKLSHIEERKDERFSFQSPPPQPRRARIWRYFPRGQLVDYFFQNYPRTLNFEESDISEGAPDDNISSNIIFLISLFNEENDAEEKVKILFSSLSYIFSNIGFMRRNWIFLFPIFQMLRLEVDQNRRILNEQGLEEHINSWLGFAEVCFQL